MNTGADESDAPFTVGRKGPQVFILAPEENGTVPPGTPLFLRGYAYDLEDGTLDGAALRWSSDRDGDLGTGSLVLVRLSAGPHRLTLSATDGDGPRIVNISNPANPTETGFYDTPGGASDVAVAGDYAYVADWVGGLLILKIPSEIPSEGRVFLPLILNNY